MVASQGDLLFAKALLCVVSVVKGDRVQDGASTSCVCRKVSVSMATNGPVWQIHLLIFLYECRKNDAPTSEK